MKGKLNVKRGNARSNRLKGTNRKDALFGLAGNDQLSGLLGNDRLNGGSGNDILDGGLGQDQMIGGVGDDTYVVDDVNDRVIEQPNQGIDTIQSFISLTLIETVESLALVGTQSINGIGNSTNNYIVGNDANNSIAGGAGDDWLVGGGGDDVLDGGIGADRLVGGPGNDAYFVDDPNLDIIEETGGGTDLMIAPFGTLPGQVEDLQLYGEFDAVGSGNALNNRITGNAGNNLIDGRGGNDTLVGGPGNDQLTGGLGADTFLYPKTSAFYSSKSGIDTINDYNQLERDVVALSQQTLGLRTPVGSRGFTVSGDFQFFSDFLDPQTEAAYAGLFDAQLVYSSQTGRLFYNPNRATPGFGPDNTGGAFTQILGVGLIQFVIVE